MGRAAAHHDLRPAKTAQRRSEEAEEPGRHAFSNHRAASAAAMSYRPITDVWFLARAKLKDGHKYYGAYLGGFPERARALLGATITEPVLHVCGGMAKHYPYGRGFGPNDKTLDLDIETKPDFLRDARDPLPSGFKAILMDPPYSEADAEHYRVGAAVYPKPNALIKNALNALNPGQRVGLIHYVLPSPPKGSVFVAGVGVMCGFNNRIRVFSVFEKALDQP
jgi:hypothetical protein